jgi:hypothetical protein
VIFVHRRKNFIIQSVGHEKSFCICINQRSTRVRRLVQAKLDREENTQEHEQVNIRKTSLRRVVVDFCVRFLFRLFRGKA